MTAAVRLWWLLRAGGDGHGEPQIAASFGLLTWAALCGAGLLHAARLGTPDPVLTGALAALTVALALTAGAAVHTLALTGPTSRPAVLRAAGATRAQTALVCVLDILEAAWPGVLAGVAAHWALCLVVAGTGAPPTVSWASAAIPLTACLLAVALLARRRLRTTV